LPIYLSSKTARSIERIENKIYLVRGQKVMLDFDLAKLYGVTTGRLNEQVKRNIKRFPGDFMFQLSQAESKNLISQFAISSWGGARRPARFANKRDFQCNSKNDRATR
jgi:hypothetical protein